MTEAEESICPKCGHKGYGMGPAQVAIRQADASYKHIPCTPLYKCASGCTQDTTYGGEWDIEWVIDDGQKIIVEPSAGEFA